MAGCLLLQNCFETQSLSDNEHAWEFPYSHLSIHTYWKNYIIRQNKETKIQIENFRMEKLITQYAIYGKIFHTIKGHISWIFYTINLSFYFIIASNKWFLKGHEEAHNRSSAKHYNNDEDLLENIIASFGPSHLDDMHNGIQKLQNNFSPLSLFKNMVWLFIFVALILADFARHNIHHLI
mgnify:CR=1 FL=1